MSITQYLILDFDGVIGDTFDACVLAYLYLEPDLSIEEAKMNLKVTLINLLIVCKITILVRIKRKRFLENFVWNMVDCLMVLLWS
ncbi:hypothetical protein HC766_02255 [Candidatus Gracilibacteria bacterium]|nr:hypothetical protein [Candidatus Gracilibacteria bacterium]